MHENDEISGLFCAKSRLELLQKLFPSLLAVLQSGVKRERLISGVLKGFAGNGQLLLQLLSEDHFHDSFESCIAASNASLRAISL